MNCVLNKIAKGKDHKQYEYGNKVSIASTAKGNVIVGIVSHEKNRHDSHTLPEILNHIEQSREAFVKQAVVDRGYRGKQEVNGTEIICQRKRSRETTAISETRNDSNVADVQRLSPSSAT